MQHFRAEIFHEEVKRMGLFRRHWIQLPSNHYHSRVCWAMGFSIKPRRQHTNQPGLYQIGKHRAINWSGDSWSVWLHFRSRWSLGTPLGRRLGLDWAIRLRPIYCKLYEAFIHDQERQASKFKAWQGRFWPRAKWEQKATEKERWLIIVGID